MAGVALTPAMAVNGVAMAVALALAGYAWRNRAQPGATSFIVMIVLGAGWALLKVVGLASPALATNTLVDAAEWGVSALVPVYWLAFALEYTGHEDLVSRRVLAGLGVIPAITVAIVLAGDPMGLVWPAQCRAAIFHPGIGYVTDVMTCSDGPWMYVHLTYLYLLVLVGMGILFRTLFSYDALYGDQVASLLVGAIVPTATSLAWALDAFPWDGFDPTPAAFTIAGITFGNAIFRYRFMEVVPATRRIGEAAAIHDLKDGVVILDEHDRVLTMNPAAVEMFDLDRRADLGKRVGEVLNHEAFTVEIGETVEEFESADGHRTFEVTVSPVTDRHDRSIGHTLVFRDVTDRQQRKQQLATLNRVLRHNLRNDMNVVQGYADTLSERTTDPESEMAEFIAQQSSDLVEVGSKVRDMEKIMERPRSEYREFDLAALLHDVARDVRDDFASVRIVLDLPRDLWIRSDDLVVGTILENVIRNAVEHNDTDTPEVEIAAETDGDWVELTVTDNGPGIPDQEREALLAGQETALRHGSGLGLWVVNWGVTKLGGDLAFDEPAEGGTVVELRLPGSVAVPDDRTRGRSRGDAPTGGSRSRSRSGSGSSSPVEEGAD